MRPSPLRIASTLLILGAIGLLLWGGPSAGAAPEGTAGAPASARRVRLAPVEAAPATRLRLAHGVVKAADRAALGFPTGGRLVARPVEVGTRVRAGQLLARVDPTPFRHRARAANAAVTRIEAEAAQLARDRERVAILRTSGAVSAQVSEQTSTALEATLAAQAAARTEASEAQRLLRESALYAAFDGVVTAVLAEPGETVAPGAPVVVLSGEGAREIEVEVSASLAAALRPGVAARVTLPTLEARALEAEVRAVADSTPHAGRLYPVVLSLAAADVPAGVSAEVRFEVPAAPAVVVPTAAVLAPTGERASVYRVVDGVARLVDVELGELLGDRIVARGRIAPGEQVVVAGYVGLLDGDAVEVAP